MPIRKHSLSQPLVWLILIIGIVFLFYITMDFVAQPDWLIIDDYVEYWAAGRLNITGGNPYQPKELLPLQHPACRFMGVPVMMYNPPWTMVLVMPFGAIDYQVGRAIWLLATILVVIICSDIAWRLFGGLESKRIFGWLIGLSFVPILDGLRAGQISTLSYLGVVFFLYYLHRKNDWLAGVSLALLAVKPHTMLLFMIAFFFWMIKNRRWIIFISFIATLTAATLIACAFNPSVIQQYLHALTHYPPNEWATPTIGSILRAIFGLEIFWLQYIPTIIGIVWFGFYWSRNHLSWNWHEQAPLITLVSIVTSAYGWIFDLSPILIAIILIAIRIFSSPITKIGWIAVISYLSINIVDFILRVPQFWLWWLAPILLVWYLTFNRLISATEIQDGFGLT